MVIKHIHCYVRSKLGKSTIYKCVIDGCTHFVQKDLVEGRRSMCYRCGLPFVITKKALKSCGAKPHCDNCYKLKPEDKKLDEVLDLLIEGEVK